MVIRYGNGRTEVLEGGPTAVRLTKSACAAQMRPVDTHKDCVGCPLRSGGFVHDVIPATQIDVMPTRAKIIHFPKVMAAKG